MNSIEIALKNEKIQKKLKEGLIKHLIATNTVAKRYADLTDDLKEKSEYIFLDDLEKIYEQIVNKLSKEQIIELIKTKDVKELMGRIITYFIDIELDDEQQNNYKNYIIDLYLDNDELFALEKSPLKGKMDKARYRSNISISESSYVTDKKDLSYMRSGGYDEPCMVPCGWDYGYTVDFNVEDNMFGYKTTTIFIPLYNKKETRMTYNIEKGYYDREYEYKELNPENTKINRYGNLSETSYNGMNNMDKKFIDKIISELLNESKELIKK